jgi:hypothetical protein
LRNNESGEASGVIRSTVDQHAAVLQPSGDHAIAVPETNDQSEREKLIRRRWTETGIKMWNPDVHGAGHAALKIQGRTGLLPPKSRETLPGYDTLEFKMVRSCVNGQTANLIVCELDFDSRHAWNLMLFGRMYPRHAPASDCPVRFLDRVCGCPSVRPISFTETHPATNCIAFARKRYSLMRKAWLLGTASKCQKNAC